MNVDRLTHTARGAISYAFDKRPKVEDHLATKSPKVGPHIVFTFWDAPPVSEAVRLMKELKQRFEGHGLPIGVGLFVRPLGDVITGRDFAYNPDKVTGFLDAADSTDMPAFLNTSGRHWTDVAYNASPLLQRLESRRENLMLYEDGTRVQRKLQPPGNLLRGLFGTDKNGVLYLSYYAPEVQDYTFKNTNQLAKAVKPFADANPGLFLGISTENEVDYPGKWITRGRQTDFNRHSLRERNKNPSLTWDEFRKLTVTRVLRKNVDVFHRAGLPNIYTNQSTADAGNRASPLESGNIPNSNIGITVWGTQNHEAYKKAADLAQQAGKKWALVISNPLSLDVNRNGYELTEAILYKPTFIGIYNWWPHFWGYGVRGMPLEQAIRSLTK